MTTHRVRCANCGSVVFDARYIGGRPTEMPICINRLKPGPGPCERDRHVEAGKRAEMRLRARQIRNTAYVNVLIGRHKRGESPALLPLIGEAVTPHELALGIPTGTFRGSAES